MDLETIKDNYNNASTAKLLKLTDEVSGLDERAIPLLMDELQKRGEAEAVEKVNMYLRSIQNSTNTDKGIDYNELHLEIKERLENGENIESIKIDIKERLGNYDDFLVSDIPGEIKDDEYISVAANLIHMQEKGLNDVEIKDKLHKLGFSEEKYTKIIQEGSENKEQLIEEANAKIKSKAKNDLKSGSLILLIGLLLLFALMKISLWSLALITFGLFQMIKGFSNYRKDLNGMSKDIEKDKPRF